MSVHAAAPEHAPLQRTSLAPAPGVAVSARGCPAFHVVVQLAVQQEARARSAATEPGPEIVSASGAWLSRRTSHAESCVSVQPPEWP